jgi:hypothetical protein
MTSVDWTPLTAKILDILKTSLKDYWDADGVPAFVEDMAGQYARWTILIASTNDPLKKKEYEENLRDLNAQVHIKIASAAMTLDDAARQTFAAVLRTVGGFILKTFAPVLLTAFGL